MRSLSHLSALSITGTDALAFCQSQVTSDLTGLGPEKWHASAWCNPKGQVIAVILVRVGESGVDWVMPTSQVALIGNALSRYTIGRQVSISDPQGVSGDWAPPAGDNAHPRLAHDLSRVLCVNEIALDESDDRAFLTDWREADLKTGLAWLCPELSMRFLPQALGLESLSGLSYRKGCYPGQEVIAKVHYRGQLKHHLVLLALSHDITLYPDTTLYHQSNTSAPSTTKSCGVVIDQVANHALAVVRSTLDSTERLFIDGPESPEARIPIGHVVDLTSAPNRTPVS